MYMYLYAIIYSVTLLCMFNNSLNFPIEIFHRGLSTTLKLEHQINLDRKLKSLCFYERLAALELIPNH